MTELLEKALAKVSKLSAEGQDFIAAVILDVLEDEEEWDAALATSHDKRPKLGEKARQDIRAGRVREGWDEAFRLMAEPRDDRLPDQDINAGTSWDETEWEWVE